MTYSTENKHTHFNTSKAWQLTYTLLKVVMWGSEYVLQALILGSDLNWTCKSQSSHTDVGQFCHKKILPNYYRQCSCL